MKIKNTSIIEMGKQNEKNFISTHTDEKLSPTVSKIRPGGTRQLISRKIEKKKRWKCRVADYCCLLSWWIPCVHVTSRKNIKAHIDEPGQVGIRVDPIYRKNFMLPEKYPENFSFIMDLDEFYSKEVVVSEFLCKVLQSVIFRYTILVVVILNAIIIGVQTIENLSAGFIRGVNVIDKVVLSIFIFEMIIKWSYDFRLYWTVGWNILDFVIIATVYITAIFPAYNSQLIVLLKVVRSFRTLRSVSNLKSVTMVAKTVAKSGVDMGNILLVLIIFMLVMSVMGVILFALDELDTKYFLNALDAWYLVFICVTQDGWNSILEEFRKQSYFGLLAIYLIIGVSIGSFVFSNLIVAVIVTNLEVSVREIRAKKSHLRSQLDESYTGKVNVLPCYNFLAEHNIPLLMQEPLMYPLLQEISKRRLLIMTKLVVALEQNMLEAELISVDLIKIMAVIISISAQLDLNVPPENEKLSTGKEVKK